MSKSNPEIIQSLWGGYGTIERIFDEQRCQSVIHKNIDLGRAKNHPRGWNTNLSHERKVKSYEVELNWYQNFNNRCTEACRTPEFLAVNKLDGKVQLVLEDLNEVGFTRVKSSVSVEEAEVCLRWLANFHAEFLNVAPDGLWEIGTYWHLATRPDELEVLGDVALKEAASTIDARLNSARFQTLVHGDAKLANFCFSKDGEKVAAVDFQYVGQGCGMKDVAYFIGSCFHEEDCRRLVPDLLSTYFEELRLKLGYKGILVEQEWRELFPWAWADFHRFMKGWSPGHWKINSYSEEITRNTLLQIEWERFLEREVLPTAITAAKEAGAYILSKLEDAVEVQSKSTGSSLAAQVVTEVDIESQRIILEHLEPVIKANNFGLLAEEENDDKSRLKKAYFITIDPLDGTLAFTQKKPGFSVAIALLSKEGMPQLGVVYDPSKDKLYHFIKGHGAFVNGEVLNRQKGSERLDFFIDRSFLKHPNFDKVVEAIGQPEVHQKGGAVLNALWAIENQPACYFKFPKEEPGGGSIWDFATSVGFYNELGAYALSFQKEPLFLNDLLSTFLNTQGAIFCFDDNLLETIYTAHKELG